VYCTSVFVAVVLVVTMRRSVSSSYCCRVCRSYVLFAVTPGSCAGKSVVDHCYSSANRWSVVPMVRNLLISHHCC